MRLHLLLEDASGGVVVKGILERYFQLQEEVDYWIHPHRGKGTLPKNPLKTPESRNASLLNQLPAKLRAYASLPQEDAVVVLLDADNDDCKELKQTLVDLYDTLDRKPTKALFRIAVEEMESWFLADPDAIKRAYPKAKIAKLPKGGPDRVVGAWERLAEVVGKKPSECDGTDKYEWATQITRHLDLEAPKSPSLRAFVQGIATLLGKTNREV